MRIKFGFTIDIKRSPKASVSPQNNEPEHLRQGNNFASIETQWGPVEHELNAYERPQHVWGGYRLGEMNDGMGREISLKWKPKEELK